MKLQKSTIILVSILLISYSNSQGTNNFLSDVDSAYANIDSIPLQLDTINTFEQQEDAFQDYLDTVFLGVDTIFWDNKMINSGRFESKDMLDTISIVLADSIKKLSYCHPYKNYVSCNFGPRRYIHHYGVDIKLFKGDTVRAAFDGIIRVTKYDRRGFGRVIVIRHPSGLETIYGHLSKVMVAPNQKVKAGEMIGLGGSSGRSTGAHLHFETRYRGEPFDPNCIIDFENYKLKSDTLQLSRTNFEYLIELRKAKYCTIRKGDSLGRIAMRYHTSVTTLCKLNHIGKRTLIRAGRKLRYQ
jgi:murein DD-endopeptidase MepM/ murein hydrolase activator NlpD